MATTNLHTVVQHLCFAALQGETADCSDGQLLDQFVRHRDATALEALVQRHAAMVWGVCRRVLGNHHAAEDAFQATFLVLVKKANAVVPRELVGNWLYGVAHRTALKARATTAKQRRRERQVTDMPEPATAERDVGDLQALLDHELSRLPDKYRVPIVLCELEGRTRKDAARQLGVPEGTVASRLARGRALLAKRLAVTGAALTAVLAPNAAPAAVLSTTIKAATLVAAGRAAGAVSVRVAALTEGVVKAMFLAKLKIATAVLLVLGVLTVALGQLALQQASASGEREIDAQPQPAHQNNVPRVQVRFASPADMQIRVVAPGRTDAFPMLETPCRVTFASGEVYRLELSNIPNRPGVELFPTLEIPSPRGTESFVKNSSVLIEFTDDDFDKVAAGQMIVKVVYLPNGGEKVKATAVLASYDSARQDVIAEAKRNGTILAIVRMGNIDLGIPHDDVVPPSDKDRLQGTWLVTGLETDGLRLGAGRPEIKDVKAVIDGDHFTLIDKDGKKVFRIKLDPEKKPKEVLLTPHEIAKAYLGIYEVNGDTFKLCFTKDGDPRPTDFTAEVGSKRWSYTFRRDKPERADAPVGPKGDLSWERLGLKLEPVGAPAVVGANRQLHGGLKVVEVRATLLDPDGNPKPSPAARARLQQGDILIGLDEWEMLSREDVVYALGYCQGARKEAIRYYVVRDKQIVRGDLALTPAVRHEAVPKD